MSNQFVESLQLQEEQDGLKVHIYFLYIIQLFLKGLGYQMKIFWKAYQIKSYFLYMHIFNCQAVLWKKTIIKKFLLASLKTFTNSKDCLGKPHENFCSGFPPLSFGRFFPVFMYTWYSRLSEQFSELQADFGTIFRITAGYLKD